MTELKATAGEWKTRKVPLFKIDGDSIESVGQDQDKWYVKAEGPYEGEGGGTITTHLALVERCGQMSDEELAANAHLFAAARLLYEAANLLEKAEDAWANCQECEGGTTQPEICETCFPLFDDARIMRRLALAKALGGRP